MLKLSRYTKSDTFKAVEPILGRSAVFLVCFVIASGIIGPRIIGHGLVEEYGFEIYGGAGKALLFGLLALVLLIYRKHAYPKLKAWHILNLAWLALAIVSLVVEWKAISELMCSGSRCHVQDSVWIAVAHISILATVIFLLLFSFGVANLQTIFKTYKRELALSLGMAAVFFGFLYVVYGFWKVFASIVLTCVRKLLSIVGVQATYMPPDSLILNKFTISVSKYCSGIDSIALFSALYAQIGVLDWRRFNHKKYLLIFIPSLAVLFGFNTLRVFGLILGGYYINPQIAFSLFHTYAGMVLFIIYSTLFWGLSYKWMLRKS